MNGPHSRAILLGLFLLTLAFHVSVVSQDFAVLAKNGYLYDDSFYAFQISRNIALGNGVTFDGVHATNGFQPLYVFMLVPIFWASGSNLIAPIYAALGLSALFTALAAALLFLIARRYVGDWVAGIAAAIWAFSPVVAKQTANGLETSLAIFMFAWVVHFYLTRIRSKVNAPVRDFALLGALVGLAVLARVDEAALALAILVDYLLVLRGRSGGAARIKRFAAAFASCVIVYSPWMIFSILAVGSIVQDSGAATRFLSIAYAPFFHLGSPDVATKGPDAAFLWAHLTKAVGVLKLAPPVHVLFRGIEKLGMLLGVRNAAIIAGNIFGGALLLFLIGYARRRKDDAHMSGIGELRFLPIVAVILVAAYSFYVFGVFFFIRYLYPVYFIACIYAAFFISSLSRRLAAGGFLARRVVPVAIGLYVAAFAFMAITIAYRSQPVYCFYDVATWVRANTSPDETIGVFQGGAVGYLSNRRVINLDGKVNREALKALRERDLSNYIEREGVDVVLDRANVLGLFLQPDSGSPGPRVVDYRKIMHGSSDGVPGWTAFRLESQLSPTAPAGAFSHPKTPSSLR